MAASCVVKIDVEVTGLGNEVDKRVRFATTNTIEAINTGYGTIAVADTYEGIDFGQVDQTQCDGLYLKSIDNDMYVYCASVAPAGNKGQIFLAASEACFIRPSVSTGLTVSVMIMSDTAGAKYEYLVVGQSS
ncbi:MAG: hypothetical protein ACXADL_11990 [Candidatus Thorarchaeota archaeon]|jgi:hypothetical protein